VIPTVWERVAARRYFGDVVVVFVVGREKRTSLAQYEEVAFV
jgi:hypothetical protein